MEHSPGAPVFRAAAGAGSSGLRGQRSAKMSAQHALDNKASGELPDAQLVECCTIESVRDMPVELQLNMTGGKPI